MNEAIEKIKRILREMWHRRWIGLVVAWVAGLIGIAVVVQIPERYEASARVFVDTKSILKPLLQGLAIQPDVNQQVAMVSRTLISRPNVEKVIRMADLDLQVKNDAQRDKLIDATMRSISLASARGGENLYTISFRDPQPEKARKVVQSMLTIFVESSVGDERQDSRAAVRFLDDQIKTYEKALQAAENRLKEFKLRHLGFTERAGGGDYFERLAAIQTQINAAKLELGAAEQARDSYKKELAGSESGATARSETVPQPPPASEPAPEIVPEAVPEFDGRIGKLKGELDELNRRYTENHPDVVTTRRVIGDLETQRKALLAERRRLAEEERRKAAEAGGSTGGPSVDPVSQQLRVALAEAEGQVAAARGKVNGLEAQYAQLRGRATMVPEIENEFTQLNRDYDVQKRTYEGLLARRESAVVGIGAQDSGGAQFRVIDPPRVAPNPVAPNRMQMLGIALLASLAAGLAASFVASQLAPTFHDASMLRQVTSRPVLGLITLLPNPKAAAARRRRSLIFAGGAGGLVAVFAGVAGFSALLWRLGF
jgi:polysaccharide chain length determinant protein (PEP-CTERM system associated)